MTTRVEVDERSRRRQVAVAPAVTGHRRRGRPVIVISSPRRLMPTLQQIARSDLRRRTRRPAARRRAPTTTVITSPSDDSVDRGEVGALGVDARQRVALVVLEVVRLVDARRLEGAERRPAHPVPAFRSKSVNVSNTTPNGWKPSTMLRSRRLAVLEPRRCRTGSGRRCPRTVSISSPSSSRMSCGVSSPRRHSAVTRVERLGVVLERRIVGERRLGAARVASGTASEVVERPVPVDTSWIARMPELESVKE